MVNIKVQVTILILKNAVSLVKLPSLIFVNAVYIPNNGMAGLSLSSRSGKKP